MMLNINQIRLGVVRPVLSKLDIWTPGAEELVMGTGAQESAFTYIEQIGGPALGLFQMEPATHDDIWQNSLKYRTPLAAAMHDMFGPACGNAEHLKWNMGYAAAMCRIHYLRAKGALPDPDDIKGMAAYWKQHYNTVLGAGTESEFMHNYRTIVKGGV